MNRSIIETALTNKALPLELNYRKPSMQTGETGFEDPTEVRFALQNETHGLTDEFICLLRVF